MKKFSFIVALHLTLTSFPASAVLYDKEALGFSFNDCPTVNPCDAAFTSHLQKAFPVGISVSKLEKAIEAEKYKKFSRSIENDVIVTIIRLPDEDEDAVLKWTKSPEGKLTSISGYLSFNRGKIKDKTALNQIGYLPPILQDLSSIPYKEGDPWLPKGVWEKLNKRLQDRYPVGTPIDTLRQQLAEQGFLEYMPPDGKGDIEEWRFVTKVGGIFYEEWRSDKTPSLDSRAWWYIRFKSQDKKTISSIDGGFTQIF